MRKNLENKEILEGRLYDIDVTLKKVENTNSKYYGQDFYSGQIFIATDEEGLNVIPVHYTFITRNFASSGKPDSRFSALTKMAEEQKTWLKVGKDEATMLRVTPSADVNDFYPEGSDKVVSTQRNEGGFINFLNTLSAPGPQRNKFIFDMIINNVKEIEPKNEEDDAYAIIHGVIFNFRKEILPFNVVARKEAAIDYFMSLDASKNNPVFTQVWGEILSTTIKTEREIENAFGEPAIDYSEVTRREWVCTGAKPTPYGFGDESNITKEELEKAVADRNMKLEEIKTRAEEYYASRKGAAAPVKNTIPSSPSSTPLANVPDEDFDW